MRGVRGGVSKHLKAIRAQPGPPSERSRYPLPLGYEAESLPRYGFLSFARAIHSHFLKACVRAVAGFRLVCAIRAKQPQRNAYGG
jgi:hypothetical protein